MEVESASKSHDAGAVAKKKAIEVIRQAAPSPRDGERSGQVTRVRAEGFAEALAGPCPSSTAAKFRLSLGASA
jgi:hypothetical protein